MTDSAPPVRTLIVDDEPPAREHLRDLLRDNADIRVIGECGDGDAAVAHILAHAPDLVFLDVQMPERDGFDVVRAIGVDRMPAVVFVTAFDQHALAAFEVHAIDYVLKPVNRARFARAVTRAVRLVRERPPHAARAIAHAVEAVEAERAGSDRLAVRVGDRIRYLRIADIDWVEAADDVVRLHVGRDTFEHRTTLSQLEHRLPTRTFVRVHRSAIVNVERIREFLPWFQGDWIIVLSDGTRVQTGKSYRARVRELLEG